MHRVRPLAMAPGSFHAHQCLAFSHRSQHRTVPLHLPRRPRGEALHLYQWAGSRPHLCPWAGSSPHRNPRNGWAVRTHPLRVDSGQPYAHRQPCRHTHWRLAATWQGCNEARVEAAWLLMNVLVRKGPWTGRFARRPGAVAKSSAGNGMRPGDSFRLDVQRASCMVFDGSAARI